MSGKGEIIRQAEWEAGYEELIRTYYWTAYVNICDTLYGNAYYEAKDALIEECSEFLGRDFEPGYRQV